MFFFIVLAPGVTSDNRHCLKALYVLRSVGGVMSDRPYLWVTLSLLLSSPIPPRFAAILCGGNIPNRFY